jgi:hypothetical protein
MVKTKSYLDNVEEENQVEMREDPKAVILK